MKLFTLNDPLSIQFKTYARLYNNMFAFSSMGVNNDKALARNSNGVYTFRVQGQIYHFIDDLLPTEERTKIFATIFL